MRKSLYYPRSIDRYLTEWKNEPGRKPLLLRGARRVGKSSSVRRLGTTFKYFMEVNFERDREIHSVFAGNPKPKEIASRLAAFYGVPAAPGETLVFLDEVQACPDALRSLRFFREDCPELHVAAAGSLPELVLKKTPSFGAGGVSPLFMYPMSFDEFLAATGHDGWIEAKRRASPEEPLFEALHLKLVDSFRDYLTVGGMPEVVDSWARNGGSLKWLRVQDDLMRTYEDDFSKYGNKTDPALLRQTLREVADQTGGKFVYSNVPGNYRTEKIKNALELLKDAGLIIPAAHTGAGGAPPGAGASQKFVKYIFLDSGLLLRSLGSESTESKPDRLKMILTGSASDLVNGGSAAETAAGLELLKYGAPSKQQNLYYWQSLKRGAQAEVDYVIVRDTEVVPVEVKAGTKGTMKSMSRFMEEKHRSYGIRTSLENFGKSEIKLGNKLGKVDIIPLYALSNLFV